jgi:hypothetical protein
MGISQARLTGGIIVTTMAVTAAVAAAAAQPAVQPRPLKQFLEDNGWVSLSVPDRRMGPGSVIKVTKQNDTVTVQWIGNLRRCGITDAEFGFVRGKYPPIGIGEIFGVGTSVALAYITRLHGTADLAKASQAILRIEAAGGDAVDLARLATFLARPAASRMMSQCRNILAQEDTYLVSEAFRVSGASYALLDANGERLAIAGEAFERGGLANTLNIAEDLYVGVRHVRPLAPILYGPGPGQDTVPEADRVLRLPDP